MQSIHFYLSIHHHHHHQFFIFNSNIIFNGTSFHPLPFGVSFFFSFLCFPFPVCIAGGGGTSICRSPSPPNFRVMEMEIGASRHGRGIEHKPKRREFYHEAGTRKSVECNGICYKGSGERGCGGEKVITSGICRCDDAPIARSDGVLRSLGMCAAAPAPYIHTVTGSRDTMVIFGVPTQHPVIRITPRHAKPQARINRLRYNIMIESPFDSDE